VDKNQFTEEQVQTLKGLANTLQKYMDAGIIEGVSISSNSHQNVFLNADELSKYLGISIKTVYYRSAPKSVNPFPFKPIRIGGSKRGRLRFKKSDVYEAEKKGVI
jgi:predicted DNA-binding transcriptional regulator AlpA